MPSVAEKTVAAIFVFIFLPLLVFPVQGYLIPLEWINEIEYYSLQVDEETTVEIVVVVLQSLNGHGITDGGGNEITDIVQLAVFIFNELPLEAYEEDTVVGIGKEGKDNGVLILLAINEQQWRIEIGYGLEGYITDLESNRIAQDYLLPELSEGNYGEGLYYTVVALAKEIPITNQTDYGVRGVYYYEQNTSTEEIPFWETDWFMLAIVVLMILFGVTVGIPVFRRGGGRGRGGRSGGGGSSGKW
jgi:uncharacterized protein